MEYGFKFLIIALKKTRSIWSLKRLGFFFSSLKKLIFTFNHVKDIYDSFENPLKQINPHQMQELLMGSDHAHSRVACHHEFTRVKRQIAGKKSSTNEAIGKHSIKVSINFHFKYTSSTSLIISPLKNQHRLIY